MEIQTVKNITNRANGKYFEDLISDALDYYYEKGYASIEKTPEPMKPLKNCGDGTFLAIYTKKAQPDYKGVLYGGECIIFEAKYTDTDRIRQQAVTDTQAEIFERYQHMNAQCYVMVCMHGTEFFRVPWNIWKGMKKIFGHKYMTQKDLQNYRIQYRQTLLLLEGIELREYK